MLNLVALLRDCYALLTNQRRTLPAAVVCLTLCSCSQLPVNGPNPHSITSSASVFLASDPDCNVVDYVLVDINQTVLDHTHEVGLESLYRSFGEGRGGAPDAKIRTGDVIQINIFEAAPGGLFTPGAAASRPSNFASLPPQTIDPQGNVTVPYAGEIHVAGKSIAQAQHEIETSLTKRAIEPQVVISFTEQNAAEVAVFGDATGSYKARIKPSGERILDVIAKAGLKYPAYETLVTLERGRRRASVYMPVLLDNPSENIYVRPGDIIFVGRRIPRVYAFGALGSTTQTSGAITGIVPFDAERMSLAEAIAKAGGLLDTQAGPQYVFIYRSEYRGNLKAMGANLQKFPPNQDLIPTIYRANFRDPSSYFFAHEFQMHNKDIIYVANADAVEVSKFLVYTRLITNTVAGATTDIVATRDAVRALATGR